MNRGFTLGFSYGILKTVSLVLPVAFFGVVALAQSEPVAPGGTATPATPTAADTVVAPVVVPVVPAVAVSPAENLTVKRARAVRAERLRAVMGVMR
jgi:hypothetical protein